MKAVQMEDYRSMDEDYRDFQLRSPVQGVWPVGSKGKDVISSYVTGNVPGGLGSHDGNGITSQVIAFFLGFFHGLAIAVLRKEVAFRYSTQRHSKIVFLLKEDYFACKTNCTNMFSLKSFLKISFFYFLFIQAI